ncbi:MAG TPA: insulinase family protein [Candidatus Polarisedimenticolaceae bacterium]|nr:insulinase family protein [Candidatus Polarisedimenticolaceae bacterium]
MALPAVLLSAAAAAAAWSVDGATEAVLVEDHRVPIVTIVVELPIGTWSPFFTRRDGETAFTFQDDDPARSLRRRMDATGITIDLDVDRRFSVMRATTLTDRVSQALGLVKEILANRDYDGRELSRHRRERQILWRQTDTDVGFRLSQAAARELFAEGDPRRTAWEKPPDASTNGTALAEARDEIVRTPVRLIGFAGDVTRADAERWAADLLPPAGAAPSGVAPALAPVRPAADRARERDLPIRKLTQVYLAYVRDSIPFDDPRRPAFLIADHVLGGHFYSRLVVALRHEGGETYGAGTRDDGDVVSGIYRVSTFTRADNAAHIEAKLRQTLSVFRESGITEEERAGAVSALSGARAFARQAPAQLLARYRLERRLGLPEGAIDATIDRAADLPLDEINAFIREFYDPAAFSMLRAVPR